MCVSASCRELSENRFPLFELRSRESDVTRVSIRLPHPKSTSPPVNTFEYKVGAQ